MVTRREMLRLVPVAVVGLGTGACGYALVGRGTYLPSHIQSVAVPVFVNHTPYGTLEQIFTEKVRIEFQSRGRYTVMPSESGADGVVRGEILGVSASPVGFSDARLATRIRFLVIVHVKFDDVKQQKTLWENEALRFSDEYELATRGSAGLAGAAFLDQERVAVDRLATDFARSVVGAILEAF